MSKADEMFEELGYINHFEVSNAEVFKKGCRNYFRQIAFNKTTKSVMVNYYLSMQELKAINEKCKELNWL